MPSENPGRLGEIGARAAARKFNLELRSGANGFWDARHKSNGRKVQIKSASHSRADGPGVIRVWREHLESLEAVGGSVVVVVVSRDADHRPVRKVRKVSPAALLDAAEWRVTGQADMAPMQEARLRWPEVVGL